MAKQQVQQVVPQPTPDVPPSQDAQIADIGNRIARSAIAVIDTKRDRIRLSVKKLDYIKNQALLDEINDDSSHSLGDLIKDQMK